MTAVLAGDRISVETCLDMVEIIPGVIDPDSEYVFTNGQCHALAMALHQATGWPLYRVKPRGYDCCPTCAHWMVGLPDGRLLDIMGVSSRDEVRMEWGRAVESNRTEWAEVQECCYLTADMEAAESFVSVVIETYVPELV